MQKIQNAFLIYTAALNIKRRLRLTDFISYYFTCWRYRFCYFGMKRHNSISEVTANKNSQSNVDLETTRHSADDVNQIRQLLEKYSSSIETFQRVNLKQDIFNYCLCTEEPFELEKFF